MSRELEVQREVTRVALQGIADAGFALAGSGAIREHGLTDRPTEDVDLFTENQDPTAFAGAVSQVVAELGAAGYSVDQTRTAPQFARLHVVADDGSALELDLGVDWRGQEAVVLEIGPVLALEDAVGSKVNAVYSRGEVRDFLDLDAIRSAGRLGDEVLLDAVLDRDPGFSTEMFVRQLESVRTIRAERVVRYGVTESQWRSVQERTTRWAASLRDGQTRSVPGPVVDQRRASFPDRPSGAAGPTPADAPERPSGAAPPGPDLGR